MVRRKLAEPKIPSLAYALPCGPAQRPGRCATSATPAVRPNPQPPAPPRPAPPPPPPAPSPSARPGGQLGRPSGPAASLGQAAGAAAAQRPGSERLTAVSPSSGRIWEPTGARRPLTLVVPRLARMLIRLADGTLVVVGGAWRGPCPGRTGGDAQPCRDADWDGT